MDRNKSTNQPNSPPHPWVDGDSLELERLFFQGFPETQQSNTKETKNKPLVEFFYFETLPTGYVHVSSKSNFGRESFVQLHPSLDFQNT